MEGHAHLRAGQASQSPRKANLIYAIKCGKWVKFGKANSVDQRLRDLQIGNPYKLKMLMSADWPDEFEGHIHRFLEAHLHRGEWFIDCIATRRLIDLMADKSEGQALFRTLAIAERCFRTAWIPPLRANDGQQEPTSNAIS